ncbi:hypothetical protein [Marinomonas posidonica]|uniref:hypothetical protein n=1 Tax=Marinomonas posidonica TaxID=936476 RepID=UPI00373543D4
MMLYAFKLGAKYPIFTKQIQAKKDPVTGREMIPAFATNVELIAEKDGHQRYFKNGSWHYVVDKVGTQYWLADGSQHTIATLGEEVPEGALLEEPEMSPTLEEQTALANTECTRRINIHWNQIGQINASLGIYGEEDKAACAAWISANREALIALLDRDDLVELDVSDDQYWPSFEG